MREIAVGDHVRLLSGREEGYVRSIRKNVVEVEIEDGFIIPVLDKELVVIAKEEKKYFQSDESKKDTPAVPAKKVDGEFFLAIKPLENPHYQLLLINQTLQPIYYCCYISYTGKWQNVGHEAVNSADYAELNRMKADQFTNQTEIIVNWMGLARSADVAPTPFSKSIKLKSKWIMGNALPLPLVEQKGFLIPLTGEEVRIDPTAIMEAMFTEKDNTPNQSKTKSAPKIENIVDLHIESLVPNPAVIRKEEMLDYQVQFFSRTLDAAIAQGLDDITFIHGVGNGTLKYNLEKKLSGHPHIAYFKDAQKEKFGYGAIFIKLK